MIDLSFDGDNSDMMRQSLIERFPELQDIPKWSLAINGEYVQEAVPMNDGDEVAVIPPVSGG
jgi:molybdopterin converting factor small subunit